MQAPGMFNSINTVVARDDRDVDAQHCLDEYSYKGIPFGVQFISKLSQTAEEVKTNNLSTSSLAYNPLLLHSTAPCTFTLHVH